MPSSALPPPERKQGETFRQQVGGPQQAEHPRQVPLPQHLVLEAPTCEAQFKHLLLETDGILGVVDLSMPGALLLILLLFLQMSLLLGYVELKKFLFRDNACG